MYIVCEDMYMYSYIYSTIAYYGMGVALMSQLMMLTIIINFFEFGDTLTHQDFMFSPCKKFNVS